MKKKLIMYDLAPQMKVYDMLGQVWKPFIMYISRPNFKSEVINLDRFGLRFNDLNNKYNELVKDLSTKEFTINNYQS